MNVLVDGRPEAGVSWESDDWVLAGVKVSHETGEEVWLVRLSILRPEDPTVVLDSREFEVPFGLGSVPTGAAFTAPVGKVLVETFDRNGESLRSSIRTIPQVEFRASILDVLAGTTTHRRAKPALECKVPMCVEPCEPTPADLMHAIAVMELMSGARALVPIRDAIRDHIIHRPSLVALMLNGFRLKVVAPIDRSASLHTCASHAYIARREEAKFPLMLAGQRLFDCRVVTGSTESPFNLMAGATMVEAVNPEKPTNRLTVCVLASKSGVLAPRLISRKSP